MTLPSTLDLEIAVSWDGSGDFDGPDDDVTPDTDGPAGLVLDQWRDGAQQLTPPKIGAGDFELYNDDGVYSPERADSPVYQRVVPTRPVRYRAGHGETRTYRSASAYGGHLYYRGRGVYGLGRHVLDDLDQTVEIGNQRVRVATLGWETLLTRANVTVALMTNPRVDQCITAILDAAGWPSDMRDISVSDTTLLYWWCDERTPWVALLELLASEGPGALYVDRDGVLHFENRNYRTTAERSTTSQATFYDRDLGDSTAYRATTPYRSAARYSGQSSGLWVARLRPLNPFKNLHNRATYTTRRRELGALAPIWSLGADLDLGSGQPRTLIVKPSDPFQNAVTPVLTTDYTVAGGTVSVTLSADSGLTAFLTVTPTSGTPTVSGLQLRAQPLTVVSETTVENTVDASASIAAFSPIPGADIPLTHTVGGWPEIDGPNAEGVCDAWVSRYMRPRPQAEVTLVNADGAHLEQILARQASDRITLVERNSGFDAHFWINSAHLTIAGAGGRAVVLVLGVERCDDIQGAVWDVSIWDDIATVWGV